MSTNSIWNFGVEGTTTSGVGVSGASLNGIGVQGLTSFGTGVYGQITDIGLAAVYGNDKSSVGNYAVLAHSINGYGLYSESDVTSSGSFVAVEAYAPSGADPMKAVTASGTVMRLDATGNLHLAGLLYSAGSCSIGCSGTKRVASFGTTAASPTIEDTGEASLVNGSSVVRIDPTFAGTIDQRGGYSVFITPEGDNRGLYVTQKTATGFVVRESMGGHSTIGFAYRIVAHPFGAPALRQPAIDIRNTDVKRNASRRAP